jgi:hypothetical protein
MLGVHRKLAASRDRIAALEIAQRTPYPEMSNGS